MHYVDIGHDYYWTRAKAASRSDYRPLAALRIPQPSDLNPDPTALSTLYECRSTAGVMYSRIARKRSAKQLVDELEISLKSVTPAHVAITRIHTPYPYRLAEEGWNLLQVAQHKNLSELQRTQITTAAYALLGAAKQNSTEQKDCKLCPRWAVSRGGYCLLHSIDRDLTLAKKGENRDTDRRRAMNIGHKFVQLIKRERPLDVPFEVKPILSEILQNRPQRGLDMFVYREIRVELRHLVLLKWMLLNLSHISNMIGTEVSDLLQTRNWGALFNLLRLSFDKVDRTTDLAWWLGKLWRFESYLEAEKLVPRRARGRPRGLTKQTRGLARRTRILLSQGLTQAEVAEQLADKTKRGRVTRSAVSMWLHRSGNASQSASQDDCS